VTWLAAIAIGATLWYLNARLVGLLQIPVEGSKRLEDAVNDGSPLGALVTFAVVPAVCEELVFRGVLARSLGRLLKPFAAAILSGLVFALYHLSLAQALPTLTFGFALGLLALRADSIGPSVVAHALNNAIVTLLSRHDLPGPMSWINDHPTWTLVICAPVTAGGLVLASGLRALPRQT
jgi:membrane protease YdiL (CAAX protease family)